MRIVLTGGWGYGNLGDDAILNSTITIIKAAYPHCIIDVLTYNIADSKIHETKTVHLHKSVHSYVDLGSSELTYKKLGITYSFNRKLYLLAKRTLVESQFWCNIKNFKRLSTPALDVIKGADLLVVAGGGYFNEKWMSNVISHLVEMTIAIELKIPFLVTGPTIGTFADKKLNKLIMNIFREAKYIYVRDSFSLEQFKIENIKSKIIPDIVLSKWNKPINETIKSEDITIGLIITNKDKNFLERLSQSLSKYSYSCQRNCSINIIMSRLWKSDFLTSLYVQKKLETLGITTKLVIPGSFHTLEKELSECSLVISENLHGLILATRNGVPIIAINDYSVGSPNYKKFISFSLQVDSKEYVINNETSVTDIYFKINSAYENTNNFIKKSNKLCISVKNKSEQFLAMPI
ncbi:hypothetical protein AU255_08555 [Methyloprofundus sedimenti]|uniref:Polysaccharide pyruvyl transferase domain-containing protein n=1 Tax=Methyloprofundus sedimenti TaxID=1420851 RepID=A0A1V8M8M4_9GAMM|nr:polysaccharide pyruvyl transferase family protein [Methyloprofundus sedimenti]OQK17897.1 hypothetical protein AU255_08555 [Methyloprofundus sedimenti]